MSFDQQRFAASGSRGSTELDAAASSHGPSADMRRPNPDSVTDTLPHTAYDIAVLILCYNEDVTIGSVVRGFQA